MDRHYVQQVCPFFATKFSLHERSRDSPFNRNCSHSEFLSRPVRSEVTIGQFLHLLSVCHILQKLAERTRSLELYAKNCYMRSVFLSSAFLYRTMYTFMSQLYEDKPCKQSEL